MEEIEFMKKIISYLIIIIFYSCSSTNNKDIIKTEKHRDIKVVNVKDIIDKNSISFNELRFSEIKSAMDTQKLMYLEYGIWDNKAKGLHQLNVSRKIWENITIFNDNQTFTIIADGTETVSEYYASLIIFDSNGKDCLEENHPLREKIIDSFYEKMKNNKNKKFDYIILR